jgi:hypothetical protein
MQIQKSKPLRKCNFCGIEANSKEELSLFTLNNECKYGRTNICHQCWREQYGKKWELINNPKHVLFGKKWFCPSDNPRINICSKCGKKYPEELKSQTHIHHESYDSHNPLDNTVELCHSCHTTLHQLQRWKRYRDMKELLKKEEEKDVA